MKKFVLVVLVCLYSFLSGSAHYDVDRLTDVQMRLTELAVYYVDVTFEGSGLKTEALLDTGAGYSVINEDVLKPLVINGMAEYIGQISGVMADGTVIELPNYNLKHYAVGGCGAKDVQVVVFEGSTRMLVGLSFLNKVAPFKFSIDPPQLSLSNCIVE